jgi:hypothetical protein
MSRPMKQKQLNFGRLLGKHFFSLLILFTYLFILLESFFYTGVLRKYILVDAQLLLVVTVFAGIFLRQSKITSKINIPHSAGQLFISGHIQRCPGCGKWCQAVCF